jgi:hypothetical protein
MCWKHNEAARSVVFPPPRKQLNSGLPEFSRLI